MIINSIEYVSACATPELLRLINSDKGYICCPPSVDMDYYFYSVNRFFQTYHDKQFVCGVDLAQHLAEQLSCSRDDVGIITVYPQLTALNNADNYLAAIDFNRVNMMIVGEGLNSDCLLMAVNIFALHDAFELIHSEDEVPAKVSIHKDNLKYDDDKCRLDLVEPSLIEAVGWIRTFGIKKYPEVYGYKKLEPWRIMGALLRHLNAYRKGEKKDPESGYPHLWHAACNLMFLIEMEKDE